MMHIRRMGMRVLHWLMLVPVTMRALRDLHIFVAMVVMTVVVPVGMFMLKRMMRVLVAVRLHQMQDNTGKHEDSSRS